MSIPTAYSDIGPFKYVPEDVRARAASLANRASARSLDAALSAAATAGGGYELNAYRPSDTAVTMAWADEDKHVSGVRKSFLGETLLVTLLTSIMGIPAFLSLIEWMDNGRNIGAPIAFGAMAAAFFTAIYFSWYRSSLITRRELRKQGFAGDALINAIISRAGKTWLLGEQALVIASADHAEASSTRTVFYDAIGTVTVTQEKGLEGVTVTGRDGLVIGRLAKPQGNQIGTAEGLAAAIRQRAEKARKTV